MRSTRSTLSCVREHESTRHESTPHPAPQDCAALCTCQRRSCAAVVVVGGGGRRGPGRPGSLRPAARPGLVVGGSGVATNLNSSDSKNSKGFCERSIHTVKGGGIENVPRRSESDGRGVRRWERFTSRPSSRACEPCDQCLRPRRAPEASRG